MFSAYGIDSIILWIGNLFSAGALFLYFSRKNFYLKNLYKKKGQSYAAKKAGLSAAFGSWLEFAVYSAGMIQLIGLIMREIEVGKEGSLMLLGTRILVTEGMLVVFLVLSVLYAEREGIQRGTFIREEGESSLAMLLLLLLILSGMPETGGWKALGWQILLLLLFFALLYLKKSRQRKREGSGQGEAALWRQEGDRQAEYLKNVDTQYQRTRELWHDLKNHIGVLEILAKEGRISEMTDYLNSFRRDVEIRMIPTRTGCTAVDALLSDKLYHARRREIEVSLQLCSLSEMSMPAVDLCAILGNLLDNAIEACEACKACDGYSGKSRIALRMKEQEDFYYLTVTNTALEPVREGEGFVSGKKGKENGVGHGLGLRSVERIAHQYGGFVATDYQEGEFKVVVRLQKITETT